MVVRQSIAHGRRAAVWTSIGIGSAILLHVAYSLLGVGILLMSSRAAFTVVKSAGVGAHQERPDSEERVLLMSSSAAFTVVMFAGAGYLAWIGFKALASRPGRDLSAAPAGAEGVRSRPARPTPPGG